MGFASQLYEEDYESDKNQYGIKQNPSDSVVESNSVCLWTQLQAQAFSAHSSGRQAMSLAAILYPQ